METHLNSRRTALRSLLAIGAAGPLIDEAAAAAPPARKPRGKAGASPYNPMAGNPLKTRDDVVRAIRDLYEPLKPFYSPGGARVRLDMAGASFDRAAADLEGFARPLWGLAPLAAGGGADFVDWALFRRGLANGCDPDHPEFWGWAAAKDQRLVEMAAIGFALHLIPQLLWAAQRPEAKRVIATYLHKAFAQTFADNNWMYFRLMIGLGLVAIGEPVDAALIADHEQKLDALYLGDGWYRDGPYRRADYYVPFAFHFYGLIYSKLGEDNERAKLLQHRARALAPDFHRWFADDGAALAFGRSMIYRFGCASYWSALAFAGVEVLPWGQIKGLVLRHLRWWAEQPMAHRDGVLSIGYSYPNLHLCEPYNSAASPYWAFKVFAFMALPSTHPFWTAKEEALPQWREPSAQRHPGLVLFQTPGDTIALASGQEEHQRWMRLAQDKYCKFAYSARYGFGIETDLSHFPSAGLENMLGLSTDGLHFHVRESNKRVRLAGNALYAQWTAAEGIEVETWLLPAAPWHVRVHRIRASRGCETAEGGFAIDRPDGGFGGPVEEGAGRAGLITDQDVAGVIDLGSSVPRIGRLLEAQPNSNLVHGRTSVPQLLGRIPAGETVLITAVLALRNQGDAAEQWLRPPTAPKLAELEALIRTRSVEVSTMAVKV